jgi:hypothetical protein
MEEERRKFIDNITKHIIRYAITNRKEKRNFREGAVEIIDDMIRIMASVVTSAGVTVDMDREKFILYMAEVANDFKKVCMDLYDKSHCEGGAK